MTDSKLPSDPTEPFVPIASIEPNAIAFAGPVRTSSGRPIAVRAGILAGSAVLVIIGAVAAMGASPAPATGAGPTTAPTSTAAPNATKNPETLEPHDPPGPFSAFPGFGFRGGDFGGFGLGGITITAVSGSDISLKTDDGWTRTITVGATTKITKAGATITVGDLAKGDKVRIGEERATDGTYTVTAIVVVLPTVAGQVSAVDGNTVTVTQPGGTKTTIHVTGDTTYQVNGAKGALSDVKVGLFIVAEGTQRSDGSLDAATVHLGFGGRGSSVGPGFPRLPGVPGLPSGRHGPKTNASPAPSGSTG